MRETTKLIRFFAPIVIFLFCGVVPAEQLELSAEDNYRVGAGDILEISVYDEPDLSKKVRIAPDGNISFPLLGKIEVEGLSTTQIEQILTEKLARDYLVNPHVSAFIAEYGSKKVSVSGEVRKPDLYVLKARTRLGEILATAGGLTENAGGIIYLETIPEASVESATGGIDSSTPGRKRLKIEVDRLLVKGDESCNLILKDGDSVYVPKADKFFVLGQVQKPGEYRLKKKTTILQAIAQAGGFTDIAASNKVKIIRIEDGNKSVIETNVDDIMKKQKQTEDAVSYLEPDDVILVPESFF